MTDAQAHNLVSEVFKTMLEVSPKDPDAFFWVTLRTMLARHRQREEERDKPVEWIVHGLHRRGPLPDEELFEKECDELLEARLRDLPEGQAVVVRMLRAEWTVAEITEALGVSASTVRTQIERLRERLEGVWPEDLRPG